MSGNNPLIDRALILIETNRYAEAMQTLGQLLSQNPQDAVALGLLAICRLNNNQKKEALEPARQAVGLAPDNPFLLTVLARTLLYNNQAQEARLVLSSALEKDPTFSNAYALMAQLEYNESHWEAALLQAEQGLEFDPEDETLINMRAMALVKLNRTKEAAETVEYALYTNPENAYSHSNKGWVQIEQGKYEAAVASFKEALRFDPQNEHARDGLKEAIKGKNWLYRGLLRYFLFMGKLSERNQWVVIIGIYVVIRLLRNLSATNEALRPFIAPIIILYMIFAFATWIGKPLSDLALRLHPLGKLALNDDEKRSSNLVALSLILAMIALTGSFMVTEKLLSGNLNILAITFFAMMIPLGGLSASRPDSQSRQWLTWTALAMLLCGPINQLATTCGMALPVGELLLSIFAIGIFAYSWIVNYILSKESRRY